MLASSAQASNPAAAAVATGVTSAGFKYQMLLGHIYAFISI
jgi:hypothetical protein